MDAEVHVDIGQADSLLIEKTFEDETVFNGIEIGDAHHIATRLPAADPRPVPPECRRRLGVVDEVGTIRK